MQSASSICREGRISSTGDDRRVHRDGVCTWVGRRLVLGFVVKDPYQQMMAEAMGFAIFIGCVIVAVLTQGCAPKLADISVSQPQARSCPTLAMPPVPDDVVLDISGDKVNANQGGEVILRGYVHARSLLRPAHAR